MQSKISMYAMLRTDRINGEGQAPILLRIDLNGVPAAFDNCGAKAYRIPVGCWDDVGRKVSDRYPNAAQINIALAQRRLELEKMFLQLEAQDVKLTRQRIKALVKGVDPGRCFYAFCRKQIKEKYDNDETLRTYRTEVTKLEEYRADLRFTDIDFEFLQGLKAWMRDVRGNTENTIWKTFKFMNTMLNDAIKIGGIIKANPFGTFGRGKYTQTQRTFLTKTERLKLEKLLYTELPEELYKVVVYELFMCYAGLRFEDAMAFDYDEHIIDDERLFMNSQKEDEQVNIKLYPKLREIILFVRDHPLQMGNKDFNKMLKIAAVMAGIDKNLTAHVGRHSFGRMLAETGVDIKKAQKLLAHRDERSTRIYYHMLDTDVDKEVDEKLSGV